MRIITFGLTAVALIEFTLPDLLSYIFVITTLKDQRPCLIFTFFYSPPDILCLLDIHSTLVAISCPPLSHSLDCNSSLSGLLQANNVTEGVVVLLA